MDYSSVAVTPRTADVIASRSQPPGREALEHARDAMNAIENEVLQALDAEDRAALLTLLVRALRGVEHDADEHVAGEADHTALTTASS